jgi:hypothetical protein
MNSNDLKNISNIYQEQVSMQLDELSADLVLRASKEASKRAAILSALGGDVPTAVKKAKKFRRQAERFYDYQAKKRRKSSVSEGKNTRPDYLDFDDDGDKQEPMTKALKDKNKKSVKEALIGGQSEIDVNKNNKIDSQDFKILRSSKNKKIKEGFSNWREDLIEVVGKIESKDSKEPKVVEKEVNNTVKINPNLDLGEAIEELGGTLLEMIEIGEVDFIVESVYGELLEEGYNEDDIEEALEYALTEATVTYGHDTPSGEKKKGNLLKAVGRLARQKLSSKVRDAKSKSASVIASGARKVAKGALSVARKMEGNKKPSTSHTKSRSASTYRGAGVGTKEKVSSGSYTPPSKSTSKKKSEPIQDPWEGDSTTPPSSTKSQKPPKKGRKLRDRAAEIMADLKREREEEQKASVKKEEYVNEKTLTSAETKEKERLVKSMKSTASDFEKRYPGRGKEVMYATATKMAKRIAENYIDEAKLPKSEKMGKKQRQSKTLKLTDCDDCTHDQRHPNAAKIHVVNPKGEKTHSLTPGEFAKHQLPSGHKYGFDEFRKTKIVKDTTKPNKRVVGYLNREDYSVIDERIRRYPEQRGVTARGSMDDNRGFTQDMKSRIGVKNLKAVHFVGDIKKGSGPEKKATVAKKIVSKRPDAKEVHFVDDHPGNVKAVTDALAKPGKTVKGKVGRTKETGPKVKGFVARPATKAKGTVKTGEVVPVRLGGEGRGGNRGIRSGTSPSGSPKETQRRRKQQRMGEAIETPQSREKPQNSSAINQVLQAKAKADAAERDLANKQRMATQKGVNLTSISS